MPFKVCTIDDLSRIDSLPVAKITHYPLEERDYKPFAQCNLFRCGKELILRMWAFEVSPVPRSKLTAVLYLDAKQPDLALCVTWSAQEKLTCLTLLGGRETEVLDATRLEHTPHSGEDLQGVYWGAVIHLPIAWLNNTFPAITLDAGATFPGNFYKLCDDPDWDHKGSYYPAQFPDNPFGRESMDQFTVVSY